MKLPQAVPAAPAALEQVLLATQPEVGITEAVVILRVVTIVAIVMMIAAVRIHIRTYIATHNCTVKLLNPTISLIVTKCWIIKLFDYRCFTVYTKLCD